MPLYEYQCTACGHRFEVIRKFSDAPLTECPRCKGQVEKLVSSPAFHLKGSGWYATDYAKKSDSSKSETKTESAASESKPAESTTKDSSSTSDSSSKDAASSTPKSSS
jgi:putative FmdB family regulatory protein